MKRVLKSEAPGSLLSYSRINPDATWDFMRDDQANGGSQAAQECRDKAIHDQGGLCAYCEVRIHPDDPLHRRIEHFHQKSDIATQHNWGLDWDNMLAVCDGGSQSTEEERLMHPLPDNLSCDSHKNHMIQTGKLDESCEGYLLNPLSIPAFPSLFVVDLSTGNLKPDATSCEVVSFSGNRFETTAELLDNTISVLNLNCDRLIGRRKRLIHNINRNIKALRDLGYRPSDVPKQIVRRYFVVKWPEDFTTLRSFLGTKVEAYLESIDYQG